MAFPLVGFSAKGEHAFVRFSLMHKAYSLPIDRIKPQQEKQDEKDGKAKSTAKAQEKKPEITTVPKARKQIRPTVVKPKVIVKPIKVIKPKIKKP